MKKFMYLLPVAALAMASCSNSDDPIAEQSSPKLASADQLLIRPAIGGASTRVATAFDATALQAAGFSMIMTGSFVNDDGGKPGTTAYDTSGTKTVNYAGGAWSLSDATAALWWGDATTKATFAAYAPAGATIGSEVEIPTALATQQDYIVAYNEGVKADFKSGVPLNFQHVTSQVVIKAKNLATSDVTIKVKGTRMVNLVSKGTLSLPTVATNGDFSWDSYTPWALGTSTATYSGSEAAEVTLEESNAQEIGQPLYLLPQQLTAATYTSTGTEDWATDVTGNAIAFLIQVKDASNSAIYPAVQTAGTEYAWAYVPVDTNWEPGKKYIYTINFTKDAYGKVDPNQEDGTDDPTDDGDPGTDDPEPGEEIAEDNVQLTFTVTVEDWTEMSESKNL
ncbi:MAG: fimbrillin family protein [Bacteroidaceae bacterium]|nr:fimbrillin family protein [Bacteroidaceae bacterium]